MNSGSCFLIFISLLVPIAAKFNSEISPCMNFCRHQSEFCLKRCIKLAHNVQIAAIHFEQSFNVKLICRDDDLLVVEWNGAKNGSLTYFIELRSHLNLDDQWKFTNVTKETVHVISNLQSDTGYYVRITGFNTEGQNHLAIVSEMFRTLRYGVKPSAVREMNIGNITIIGQTVKAILSWHPVQEQACRYDIVVWDPQTTETKQLSVEYYEFYFAQLTELEFRSTYSVGIYSVTSQNESELFWSNFTMPSCYELNRNFKNECIPESPENLKILDNNCEIIVSWDKSALLLEYYQVVLGDTFGENEYNTTFVNETQVILSTIGLDKEYIVSVMAISVAGRSAPSRILSKNTCKMNYSSIEITSASWVMRSTNTRSYVLENVRINLNWKERSFAISIGSVVAVVLLTILGLGYCVQQHRKNMKPHLKDKLKISSNNFNVLCKEKNKIDDKNINPGALCFNNILGEGEYGVVHKATLTLKGGCNKEVAVKVLRANANSEDKLLLEKEINVMNLIGSHRNIVGLLGYNKMRGMLIMEYCSLGDLQQFLKQVYNQILEVQNNSDVLQHVLKHVGGFYGSLFEDSSSETKVALNPLYVKPGIKPNEVPQLQVIDLLSFARQIALGMKYLSDIRIVHRDLAARNVLVCEDMTVKISDFGLSRDIYKQNIYVKRTNSRLPIKWMAIESMMHQVFTVQSDVWSFGILLWEIMTLGRCPYPMIPSESILRFLQDGYRLKKPARCDDQIYNVMLSCWEIKPCNRPTFSALVNKLEKIMSGISQQYLELDAENII